MNLWRELIKRIIEKTKKFEINQSETNELLNLRAECEILAERIFKIFRIYDDIIGYTLSDKTVNGFDTPIISMDDITINYPKTGKSHILTCLYNCIVADHNVEYIIEILENYDMDNKDNKTARKKEQKEQKEPNKNMFLELMIIKKYLIPYWLYKSKQEENNELYAYFRTIIKKYRAELSIGFNIDRASFTDILKILFMRGPGGYDRWQIQEPLRELIGTRGDIDMKYSKQLTIEYGKYREAITNLEKEYTTSNIPIEIYNEYKKYICDASDKLIYEINKYTRKYKYAGHNIKINKNAIYNVTNEDINELIYMINTMDKQTVDKIDDEFEFSFIYTINDILNSLIDYDYNMIKSIINKLITLSESENLLSAYLNALFIIKYINIFMAKLYKCAPRVHIDAIYNDICECFLRYNCKIDDYTDLTYISKLFNQIFNQNKKDAFYIIMKLCIWKNTK